MSKEGILENEKILTYKRERLKQEENHRRINDNFLNKFDKYCNNYSNETKNYFLKDPYWTIIDLITIYQKQEDSNI